jgi:PiT family inorganic phosphate transporter
MGDMSIGLLVVLALILGAEFVNGWTDAPNAIATVVSTRVLKPMQAVLMAAIMNTIGAMTGTAVATTIGKGIVKPESINLLTVGSAMIGILIWSTAAWYYGLPTSESHALISGLAGASLATAGPEVLLWSGWSKVLIGLVFSTFLGFLVGYFLTVLIYRAFRRSTPRFVNSVFGRLQILSSMFMAFSHGSNDGQKFMGAFALALYLGGVTDKFHISWETIIVCSIVMGLGTSIGGWRIVKTMGVRMVSIKPYEGFSAETGAAFAIELASRLGIPLSTTHTINTAIMGVGASKYFSAVRWGVSMEIVTAWILTFPICFVIGYGSASVAKYLFHIF